MNDQFNNDNNHDKIDEILNQEIPSADSNAQKIAINSALSAFTKEHTVTSHQGSSESTRPIANEGALSSTKSIWRSLMKFLNSLNNNKAFAGVAVGVACLSVVSILPSTFSSQQNAIDVYNKSKSNSAIGQIADSDAKQLIVAGIENRVELESQITNLEEIVVTTHRQSDFIQDAPVAIELNKVEHPYARKTKKVQSMREPSASFDMGFSLSDQEISPQIYETEEYANAPINKIKLTSESPVSTFSIDVDTASYSLIRNQLNSGYLPPSDAVRVEEMINYFDYAYPLPTSESAPFKATTQVLDSPWNKDKKLVHIGIQGYDIDTSEKPDSNLVFLLDVSGSMGQANKLPLVKQSIGLLLSTLKADDKVSIVVYAGAAGVVLKPTKAQNKDEILAALNRLQAGGSTAGGAGIELAYQLAQKNFIEGGVNRIILATDGDFNVGQSSNDELKKLVERKRKNGVMLSVLGFGRGNYQDDMMQTLAQNGNGVAAYIDSLSEAKKVLVDEASSTLFTIAKDVKLQLEFNPEVVSEYRLVGYETRQLQREDFNNDKVDAGDIGSGHSVTAIYEIGLSGSESNTIAPLRYTTKQNDNSSPSGEIGFLKIRYKLPKESTSKLIETPIKMAKTDTSADTQFSIAVASFGQKLSGDKYNPELSYSDIAVLAKRHLGNDPYGHKAEFIQLVEMANLLNKQ